MDDEKKDFFVSYAREDEKWADWVAFQVERLGYTITLDLWDFTPGVNYIQQISSALESCAKVLLILSRHTLESDYVVRELSARTAKDLGERQLGVVPIRVDDCELEGLLRPIVYADLHGKTQAEAIAVIRQTLHSERRKPPATPAFPGSGTAKTRSHQPGYPGPSRRPPVSARVVKLKPVLQTSPNSLIGRTSVVEEVVNELSAERSVYLYGLPGVGKSSLATVVARRHVDSGGSAIYESAQGKSFDDILDALARALGANAVVTLDHEEKLRQIQDLLVRNAPILVYLDDVVEVELYRSLSTLQSCSTLLLTGRAVRDGETVSLVRLNPLSRESAIQLFCDEYKLTWSPEIEPELQTICRLLGDHPLALKLCARRARFSGYAIESLARILEGSSLAMTEFASASVRECVALSYELLTSEQGEFLRLLSLFQGRSFSYEAAKSLRNDTKGLGLLNALNDLSLVTALGNNRHQLHPMIHEFALEKYGEDDPYQKSEGRFVEYYLKYAERNRTDFPLLETDRLNILAAMKISDGYSTPETYLRFADALLRMYPGHYAYGFLPQKGYWTEAKQIVLRSLELQVDERERARLYEHLGLFHYWLGDHVRALAAYEEAMKICKRQNDYHEEVVTLHRIGFIKSDEGDYKDCESLYRQSVELCRKQGLGDELYATSVHLVGVVLYHQGRYEDAAKELLTALEIRKTCSSVAVSVTERRLAAAYRRLERFSEAEHLLKNSFETDRKAGNERNVGRVLRQFGMLYLATGRFDEALEKLQEAYEIFDRIGNKQGLGGTLSNLGELACRMGRQEDARRYLDAGRELALELRSTFGLAQTSMWLGEIDFLEEHYLESAENAYRAIDGFGQIAYSHPELAQKRFANAISRLEEQQSQLFPIPSIYLGRYSSKIKESFERTRERVSGRRASDWIEIHDALRDPVPNHGRGLSVIIRLDETVDPTLNRVTARLRATAPSQHYYDSASRHITVASVIPAIHPAESIERLATTDLEGALDRSASGVRPFDIWLQGLSVTPVGIVVNGFFPDATLDSLRRRLWVEIEGIAIPKFKLVNDDRISAHVTVARFRALEDADSLVSEATEMSATPFGPFRVRRVELVSNDWYMTEANVKGLLAATLGTS